MESDSTAYSLMSLQQDIPDELPSWDFAEDVLGGFDQFLDVSSFSQVNEGTSAVRREQAPAAAEPAGPSVSDADELEPARASRPSSSRDPDGKKQRQNRQAQQRFRQRQRARTESLEAQDISRMPFTELVSLYTAYARKISQCLTQIAQQSGSTSDLMEELHKWTSEVSAMLVFLAVGNLKNYLTFTSSRLDGNIGPSVSQLPDTYYRDFVTRLHLTEAQRIDLMHLRRFLAQPSGGGS
ncbi:hypothetical protein WJX79_007265 [Trebouxia sp. C0005]